MIDPARNAVVGQIAVGVRPGDISAGAGGIWVANLDDNSVSQIDPRSASVKHGLSVGGAANDALATSADEVWTMRSTPAACAADPALLIDSFVSPRERTQHGAGTANGAGAG